MLKLEQQRNTVNQWMQENSARFSVTRKGVRQESDNPYDPIPRVLPAEDFTLIEQGLIQRVNAINLFMNDIYSNRMILQDGVIPEEFIFSSPDFLYQCMHITPPKSIYTHIAATNLVHSKDGRWYVSEDRLSMPVGMAFPHLARKLCRQVAPEEFAVETLCDNCGLDILLKALYHDIMDHDPVLSEGIIVILGEDDTSLAAFELQYIADLTGAVVSPAERLVVMDNRVYYRAPEGGFQKVSILHRLVPDSSLDPLCFDPDTLYGIPHLMEVYSAGNIAIINAPGCSVVEDRGLNALVPEMIRYYLDEEPILPSVPTYLPWYPETREYILDHLDSLIIKEAASTSRIGAIVPAALSPAERAELVRQIELSPRNYIAQAIMDVETLPVLQPDGTTTEAHCDFRAYTVHSDSIRVWMGGVTRFSVHTPTNERVSGFKDTWVMSK